LAIVLGTVLDGIPESVVIGVSLLAGAGATSVPIVVAVFLSNIAESISATTGLSQGGWKSIRILAMWGGITLISGLSALAGYALFGSASPQTIAFVLAFAGGAILVMLADTMMPEAFARGGKLVGLVTAVGFALAFALSQLG
jgi:ZIP family zinc transporter